MTSRLAIGIDLGGTNLKVGFVDSSGQVIAVTARPTQAEKGPGHFVETVARLVDSLRLEQGLDPSDFIGIGLGTPGPLNLKTGIILKAANLPGWSNVAIRDLLADRLGLPAVLENDANVAAFGEFWLGRQNRVLDLVLLTLGTGVGAGVVLEGRVLHGHFDNAAELGHMIMVPDGLACPCGQRGCLEAYASAGAVARRVESAIRSGESSSISGAAFELDSKSIALHAQQGDPLCGRIWDEACLYLAIACVNVQHAYNPELVLLGGGMAHAGEFLLGAVRSHVNVHRWHLHDDVPRIELARLGSDAGLLGAAGLAWASLENRT